MYLASAFASESLVGNEFTIALDCGIDGTYSLGAQTTLAYSSPCLPNAVPSC